MDPKPGFKTTEFYLSLISNTISALITFGVIGPGTEAMRIAGVIGMVISTSFYTASRASTKNAAVASPGPADPSTVPAIASLIGAYLNGKPEKVAEPVKAEDPFDVAVREGRVTYHAGKVNVAEPTPAPTVVPDPPKAA